MRTLCVCFALAVLAGCDPVATQAPRPRTDAAADVGSGLFPSDLVLLGDDDFAQILDAQWIVPNDIRIALLQLNHQSELERWYGSWRSAQRVSGVGMQTAYQAIEALRSIPGVFDASYLPSFLLPAEKSVNMLREAAARYQADWIFVYSSSVRAHPDRHVFGSDEVHGICLVESALLDTRTGLIPFTSRATREIHVKEQEGEKLEGLVLRGEQEAVDEAMLQNAEALVEFVRQARDP